MEKGYPKFLDHYPGPLPAPRSGYAATVIDWDIVLCDVLEYKRNTDSCDSYQHVIIPLRPIAPHSCPLLSNGKPLHWNLSLGYYYVSLI